MNPQPYKQDYTILEGVRGRGHYVGTVMELCQSRRGTLIGMRRCDSLACATMRALLNEDMRTLIQVGDAKNLRRTLNLTAYDLIRPSQQLTVMEKVWRDYRSS